MAWKHSGGVTTLLKCSSGSAFSKGAACRHGISLLHYSLQGPYLPRFECNVNYYGGRRPKAGADRMSFWLDFYPFYLIKDSVTCLVVSKISTDNCHLHTWFSCYVMLPCSASTEFRTGTLPSLRPYCKRRTTRFLELCPTSSLSLACGKMHWFAQVQHSRANFIERVLKHGLKTWALFSCTHWGKQDVHMEDCVLFKLPQCNTYTVWGWCRSDPRVWAIGGGGTHQTHAWSDLTKSFFMLSAKGVSAAKTWQAGVQL